jgi:drug/metabolite transporter (DMT)-like permease
MVYLFLAVVCSVLLGFIFKVFVRLGIDIFQAIVFNYMTCVLCGWAHLGHFPIESASFGKPWMPYALLLGGVFITGFNTAASTVRHFGVTISQIMQKMSILISAPFAVLVYAESSSVVKILGFFLAIGAIILVNLRTKTQTDKQAGPVLGLWWIPVVTWILAGIIEVVFVRVQYEQLADMNDPTFIITVFGAAGVLGFLVACVGWFRKTLVFSWKNVLGGVVLGVPNYGSMLFMLWALAGGLEGSLVFPVANVGIIVTTAIGAVLFFNEKLSRLNWIGMGLAVLSILCIAFG